MIPQGPALGPASNHYRTSEKALGRAARTHTVTVLERRWRGLLLPPTLAKCCPSVPSFPFPGDR